MYVHLFISIYWFANVPKHFRNVIRICPLIYQSNEHICTDNNKTRIKRDKINILFKHSHTLTRTHTHSYLTMKPVKKKIVKWNSTKNARKIRIWNRMARGNPKSNFNKSSERTYKLKYSRTHTPLPVSKYKSWMKLCGSHGVTKCNRTLLLLHCSMFIVSKSIYSMFDVHNNESKCTGKYSRPLLLFLEN